MVSCPIFEVSKSFSNGLNLSFAANNLLDTKVSEFYNLTRLQLQSAKAYRLSQASYSKYPTASENGGYEEPTMPTTLNLKKEYQNKKNRKVPPKKQKLPINKDYSSRIDSFIDSSDSKTCPTNRKQYC